MSDSATLDRQGWVIRANAIDTAMLDRLSRDLASAYEWQREVQIRNGVGAGTDGTVHHLPLMAESFLQFLESRACSELLDLFFDGPYILNTFGGVLNLPDNVSYVGNVHRDLRTYSGNVKLMAQLLVMLDDFTEENGATYLLDGSHRLPDKPTDEEFFAQARRALGRPGSVVLFNSNLWHAAGVNRSRAPRRALTLAFTKPFIKQQLDYPRALGYERRDSFSPRLRQLLGYNARIPTSLDEWYRPPSERLYQRDQG